MLVIITIRLQSTYWCDSAVQINCVLLINNNVFFPFFFWLLSQFFHFIWLNIKSFHFLPFFLYFHRSLPFAGWRSLMRNQLKMASTGKTDKSNQNCWPFSVPFCGQVMWVRRTVDKFSLLSVGNVTHTGDPRFKVTFQYPNNWRLHINPMQKDDAGIYMCQVSTHPPRVFTTNVTVMREYKSFYVLLLVQPWCSNIYIYVWQVRIWFNVCVCVCFCDFRLHRPLCNYNIQYTHV